LVTRLHVGRFAVVDDRLCGRRHHHVCDLRDRHRVQRRIITSVQVVADVGHPQGVPDDGEGLGVERLG
jgi:hypothetical protein